MKENMNWYNRHLSDIISFLYQLLYIVSSDVSQAVPSNLMNGKRFVEGISKTNEEFRKR